MRHEWYKLNNNEIYKLLETSSDGLSGEEATKRLKKYGKNELPKKKKDSFFKILFKQLLEPIVLLLVVTVIFSFIIGEVVDAIAIIFIILVDLLMGTFQEWKAEKNAESLQDLIKDIVVVLRDGVQLEIESTNIVIGDIVLLESGNRVSADLKIIDSSNLQIDESVLTGESVNVSKSYCELVDNVGLSERKNMVYAGTSVVTGRAKCVVVETGIDTEIGKIANQVTSLKDTKSPLTIRMEKFSKQISLLVIVVAIIITLILIWKDVPGNEIFLSVIALSVSAMPEGLPLALTMALTIASNKMSKENVIVKKLNSVESLGSCTVIATDKTGTLTVNEQTAKKIVLPNDYVYDVDGTGYDINGKVKSEHDLKLIQLITKLGVLNNEATIENDNNNLIFHGDSIDIAFLVLGKKLKVDVDNIKKIDSIPYESENKYSAIFYEKDGKRYCTIKGSIEKVLDFSKYMRLGDKVVDIDKKSLIDQNINLANLGYRVIALASGLIDSKDNYVESDIGNLVFEGLVAFIDPIRVEVKKAISECKTAGIKVVMVTGDHPLTAFSIAKDLKLVQSYDEIATGDDVSEAYLKGEDFFDNFISKRKVFARVTPLDKFKIVESLKRQGEFVAVTGDGVNDAPAIKSASIGIAMGSGTDVAKETASMIIIDDNFKSIVSGIREGRTAYSNIRKVSYMLLSCGLAEVLFFILSIMFDLPMPLVAIQLLWLNIVTDGLQDFALSFEKSENDIMKQKPRSPKESIFDKNLLSEVLVSGLTIGIVVFAIWVYLINNVHMDVNIARGYIMVLMVFMQNIHVLNCRSENKSTFSVSLFSNPLIIFSIVSSILLQVIVMEVPILSSFLQTSSVSFLEIVKLFLFSCIILIVMELYKFLRYNKSR